MTSEEREELIFVILLRTVYSEEYLKSLSNKELVEVYNNSNGV